MRSLLPPPDFSSADLRTQIIPTGSIYGRIFVSRYRDPTGVGKTSSRFSDPRKIPDEQRFAVLYLGEAVKVCFLEALLRDQKNGIFSEFPIGEQELHNRTYAELRVDQPLTLVDLSGDGGIVMGVPSDVARAAPHDLGQAWALAFHEHPSSVDGIMYPSRLNGQTNIAVFDRAIPKISAVATMPLIQVPGLAETLNDLRISLIA